MQLLELLCSSSDDHIPYSHFVDRFLPHVQKECERICVVRKLDTHIGQQIAHQAFEKVRQYKSFKKDKIRLSDERRGINAYLNRIVVRLFNDYYNRENKKEILHATYFDDLLKDLDSQIDIKALKNKKDVATLIFSKLNSKEQKVVIADIEHKKYQKYLPDDITDALATELNVKSGSISQIRRRAIKKIKAAIDEINQN